MEATLQTSPMTAAPSLFRGRIIEAFDSFSVMVAGEGEAVKASRASSCLLRPMAGDDVLCVMDGADAFVLAVLERGCPEAPASCDLPSKTEIVSGDLLIKSKAIATQAERTDIESSRMTIKGDHLAISARLARLGARLASFAFGSFLTKTGGMRIKALETASIEAGTLNLASGGFITARSEGLDLKAQGPVSIDGQHLRLG